MIDYIQKEFIDNGKIKDSNYIIGIDMVFSLHNGNPPAVPCYFPTLHPEQEHILFPL